MKEADEFYGQEEEGFEELVEKNLSVNGENDIDDDDIDEDLLSDLEEINDPEFGENNVAVKREERLQSIMNMTRNPLTATVASDAKDEKAIKNKIVQLCSALGGIDPNEPHDYILGIEALGCLKDIKELLKRIDEERGIWSVTSACHDSGLFVNDLVPIMVQYGTTDAKNANPEIMKILLATIELMVRLLTPLRLNEDDNDNRRELYAKLRRAQIEYKNALLHYKKGKVFKYLIALMIPILELDIRSVTRRDNIILNLCLTLFGNVLRIQPSDAISAQKNRNNIINVFETLPAGIKEEDISMDVVLEIFKKYQVLSVVQTIASNLTKEFDTEILGTACLDFYYYSFVNVDPNSLSEENKTKIYSDSLSEKLNLSDTQEHVINQITPTNSKLDHLMKIENEKKHELFSKNSTRHANFGSLINIQDNKSNRVISGQKNLLNSNVLEMLDSNASKIGTGKILNNNRNTNNHLAPVKFIKLNYKSKTLLVKFIEDFIENGFGVICKEIYNILLKNANVQDYTFHYHYYFIVNWILKYERSYQSMNKRSLSSIQRYKYLFYWFSKKVIESLMNFILDLSKDKERKNYDILLITVSIVKEIMQASISLHSYEHYNTSKLLKDDKLLLASLVSRGEGTLRLIFSVNSEITNLLKLPRDSHRKSHQFAIGMIEFTNAALKVIKYLQCLKIPIMITGRNVEEYDDKFKLDEKNIKRFKTLDRNQCEKLMDILFEDLTVNTHIWLFYQYKEIDESKLKLCLNYFTKLLENWEMNILKLVRLDFMLILYQLKDSTISSNLKSDFGNILNFFMHKLCKMFHNTPMILLEAASSREMTDSEIKQYYLTGDAFATYNYTVREQNLTSKTGNSDVMFSDPTISDNEKIALLVSYLNFHDRISIVEEFVKFLNQWYNEINNSLTSDIPTVGRLNSFRLEGKCYKEARTGPYFRLLCKIGNIVNGVLIKRDSEDLLKYKQSIEISINTPLDDYQLENKFVDPNIAYQESKRLRLNKRAKNHNGENEDENEEDSYDSYEEDDGYGYEGINDEDDDLAGSESDQDELDLLEAKLSNIDNRIKGRAMRKNANGELEEMGKLQRKKNKKKSRRDKLRVNRKRLHKRRKIVQDDDGVLSESEILRRANLSKKFIEDSDEEASNDNEFFARELKLQKLLQKRHGKITKDQYTSLMDGTLNVDELSDLDDHIVNDSLPTQTAFAKIDSEYLKKLLGEDEEDEEEEASEDSDHSKNEDSHEKCEKNTNEKVKNLSYFNGIEDSDSDEEEEEEGKKGAKNKNGYFEEESDNDSVAFNISDYETDENRNDNNENNDDGKKSNKNDSHKSNDEVISTDNESERREEEIKKNTIITEQDEDDLFADIRAMRELMKDPNKTTQD